MRVEFIDSDGGNFFHAVEKENVNSFIDFLKSVDTINLFIGEGNYMYCKSGEIMYEIQYNVDDIPIEILKVYVTDATKK